MSYRLRVHLTGDGRHAPHVLAGLEALATAGRAEIEWRARPPRWRDRVVFRRGEAERVGRPYPWMVPIDVLESPSGCTGRLTIDLQDWREMFSHEALATSDVVFKRMFVPSFAEQAASAYGVAVRPAGLSHAVPKPAVLGHAAFRRGKWNQRIESAINRPGMLLRALKRRRAATPATGDASRSGASPLPEGEFAFFQVKYHPWTGNEEAQKLNASRAGLIRVLRRELGSRFQGGMYFDGEPPKDYADCVTPLPSDRKTYLALNERATVTISTEGFGASPPWKLCEYLDQGKCIVAERMPVVLDEPLEDGIHLRWFDDPEACAALCERLLSAPEERTQLQTRAKAYYRDHVAPPAAIERHLRQAESIFRERALPQEAGA